MGTGTIATEHMVAAIRAVGHEPLWVVSRNRQYAKSFSEDLNIPQTSTQVHRALLDPSVNFVYVSASRGRRKHYISNAAIARKHILCDAPIAENSKLATALVEQCAREGVTLVVNQPLRASVIHQTMRRLLLEGEIGSLQSLLIVRGAPFQPLPNRRTDEAGSHGNIFLDVSVEDIDLARFLTGQEPLEVAALPNGQNGKSKQQAAYAVRMTRDVVFQAYESFTTTEIESIVMLAGDQGVLIAHGTLNGRGSGTLTRRIGQRNELIPVRERDMHHATIEGFLTSVRRHATWLSRGADSVIALRAAEAILIADKKRRTINL